MFYVHIFYRERATVQLTAKFTLACITHACVLEFYSCGPVRTRVSHAASKTSRALLEALQSGFVHFARVSDFVCFARESCFVCFCMQVRPRVFWRRHTSYKSGHTYTFINCSVVVPG